MRPKTLIYVSLLLAAGLGVRTPASWQDKTAGIPWMEHYSARSMGTETLHLSIAEDKLGRLFVGTTGLTVHDGTTWRTYPTGTGLGVRSIQFDGNERLWLGAMNELGFFTEPSIGNFQYHSLLNLLPENERQIGHIWGVGLVGSQVYFMGRNKLYRWDGTDFKITPFPGSSRLFPLKLGEETWMFHLETGLYRLTESGPKLEYDPTQVPRAAILGMQATPQGLVLASSDGFYLAGDNSRRVFSDEVNRFVIENRLTVYAALPDGNHIAGTINGGLIIISADGEKRRVIDRQDHPAVGVIQAIWVRRDGQIWCAGQDGIFRLDSTGHVTSFHQRNGLEGGVHEAASREDRFSVASTVGVYHLTPGTGRPAAFQRDPLLKEAYTTLQFHGDGLLLGRHGGIDYFNGSSVTPLYSVLAKGVYRIIPSDNPRGSYVLSEGNALVHLQPGTDGGLVTTPLGSISDFARWLMEDTRGRVWAGTLGLGAFIADPTTGRTEPVIDPETGRPLKGQITFGHSATDLLVFNSQRVLRADPNGSNLRSLLSLPTIEPTASVTLSGQRTSLLAFKRTGASSATSWGQGLGRLIIDDGGRATWQELDVPELESIGVAQNLKVTEENGRTILWLGGSEGLLRLDYDAIPIIGPPPAPFIRIDTVASSTSTKAGGLDFPFDHHHLSFRVLTGDPIRNTDWLLQIRFGQNGADWSAPTNRRAHEFSNLSEGTYRFEARTVNAAGLASEPAVFTFRILPPWYRSKEAYAGYALALALGVWITIRLRERRHRALNQLLETQVQQRTAELVKANAAKDEFLAGVSHEIRNPMNGVIGISESLETAGLDPDSRRKFGLLRECAGHLSSLLEDLLDLSKMQVGVVELHPKPFDLHALVDTVAAMAASDSEKYHIPVEIAISPGVPRHLVGDARRIRQILLNFVSNALKFSGRGKVEVTVWCKPTGADDRTEVIFAVVDEGPGISVEEQQKLFKRFERGAAARGGRVPGTGLGLALCKGYADKMGGRIWLESEPGKGSCFYFSAPFAPAPEPAEPAPAHADPAASGRRTALVVDDLEYNRIVLTDLLAKLGCTAQSTGDGAEAVRLAGHHDFDLVFLDYDLPGMSGLEVARGIRALPGGSARAGIFATTAFNTPEKKQQCLDSGMNFFLGKPVTLERLRKALATAGLADDSAPPPLSAAPPPPADGLANLRLLASKKQVSFADEAALYLSELQVELEQLEESVRLEQPAEAAHHAHRLCGRCSFIYERELERTMRRLEESAAKAQWPEVAVLLATVPAQVTDLRLKLASAGPAVPPA